MKYHLNMSLQEWFDTLVAKRLEMTTKCTNDKGYCFYLDEKTGNRCLIGYFIPDEHQPQYLDGGANNIVDQIPELFGCTDTDLERFKYFLRIVQQELHDSNDVEAFSSPAYVCSLKDPLQRVCELFSLQLPECYKEYVQKVAEEKTKK